MKIILSLFLLFSLKISAQNNNIEDSLVKGFVSSESGNYLIVEDGYIELPASDPYEEYYRMVYNDSTIVNPNTVISGDY
ncbi:MAG: hypothetical protein R3250_04660, partial [Melioribacteraceae bacterium]|nr:hypothetical protein [Melioribacteraceae bacterium]